MTLNWTIKNVPSGCFNNCKKATLTYDGLLCPLHLLNGCNDLYLGHYVWGVSVRVKDRDKLLDRIGRYSYTKNINTISKAKTPCSPTSPTHYKTQPAPHFLHIGSQTHNVWIIYKYQAYSLCVRERQAEVLLYWEQFDFICPYCIHNTTWNKIKQLYTALFSVSNPSAPPVPHTTPSSTLSGHWWLR